MPNSPSIEGARNVDNEAASLGHYGSVVTNDLEEIVYGDEPLYPGPDIPRQDPAVIGPALTNLRTEDPDLQAASELLTRQALSNYTRRENDTRVGFAFDSSGNAKFCLYAAPGGTVSKITRVV